MDKGGVGIIDSRSFIFEAEAAEVVGEPTAEGLSIYDLLLGLAFAMKDLVEDRVRNEVVDGTPLLIAASAGTYTGAAYQRTLDGDTLTFAVALHVGSRQRRGDRRRTWGRALTRVDSRQAFWFAWQSYWPDTTLR
jgi:hypothetical protein